LMENRSEKEKETSEYSWNNVVHPKEVGKKIREENQETGVGRAKRRTLKEGVRG